MKVILSTNDNIHSWAIRLFTWSKWSHAGVIVNNKVIEATAKHGVVETSLHDFKMRYKRYKIIDVPHQGDYQTRLYKQLGKKYDWGAIFRFVLRGDWHKPDKWFCYELAAYGSGILNPNYIDRVTATHLLMISNHYENE